METIIVSVLSTLGAVALVSAIVVAFIKLTNKVDVTDFEREVGNIYNDVNKRFDDIHQSVEMEDEATRRFIDSRCDKLDTKIQDLTNNKVSNGRQLLTD